MAEGLDQNFSFLSLRDIKNFTINGVQWLFVYNNDHLRISKVHKEMENKREKNETHRKSK